MSDSPSQDSSTIADEPELDADEAASLAGHTLAGRYLVRKKLGEGAMGQVYLGEHTLMKKPVAIKVLHPELSANHEVMARFQREAQASATINHPNICAATDFGATSRNEFFLVMEYLEGRTLEELIDAHGQLDERRTLFIIDQLCKVLDVAHTHGIVHRDLKPENIMLVATEDTEDFVKVMDFGIASMVDKSTESTDTRLTRQGIAYGTPAYMSPEQVLGEDVDARSDLYTVGVILFEMLTGKVPFDGATVKKMMSKHLTAPVPTMLEAGAPHVHPSLESILRKLMAKEPEDRFQSARLLRQALREVQLPDLPWADAATSFELAAASRSGEVPIIAGAPLPTAATASTGAAAPDSTVGWVVGRVMALPLVARIALVAVPLLAIAAVAFAPESATEQEKAIAAAEKAAADSLDPQEALAHERDAFVIKADLRPALEAMARGNQDEAVAAIEAKKTEFAEDAHFHYYLGVAHLVGDDHEAGFREYGQAITYDARYASSPALTDDVLDRLQKRNKDTRAAARAFVAEHLIEQLAPRLAEMALHDERTRSRKEAFKILEETKALESLEPWKKLSLELKYASGCKDHTKLLARARELKDERVLPVVLEKHESPKRGCGKRNRKDCYGCVRKELSETVDALRDPEGAKGDASN